MIELVAAFVGGFVSYIFIRIKDVSEAYIKSKRDHLNGLVKCERLLIENLRIVSRNQPLFKDYIEATESRQLFTPFFHPFLIDRFASDMVMNIELVNLYATALNEVDHLNQSLIQFCLQYNEMKSQVLIDIRNQSLMEDDGTLRTFIDSQVDTLNDRIKDSLKQLQGQNDELRRKMIENTAWFQVSYEVAKKKYDKWILVGGKEEKLPDNIKERACLRSRELEEKIARDNDRSIAL